MAHRHAFIFLSSLAIPPLPDRIRRGRAAPARRAAAACCLLAACIAAEMPEQLLDPPVVCCEKTMTSQRALDAHRASHRKCASCTFEGSKWALSRHVCGDALAPAAAEDSEPAEVTTEFRRKDGSLFKVVDEAPAAPEQPLEERYPGARIVRAVPPASDCRPSKPEPRCATVPAAAVTVPPPADEWRVVLVLGRTGSGKSSALTALGTQLGGAAWEPSWDPTQAVVSQFGGRDEAVRWLGAVGLNAVPLWCAEARAACDAVPQACPALSLSDLWRPGALPRELALRPGALAEAGARPSTRCRRARRAAPRSRASCSMRCAARRRPSP